MSKPDLGVILKVNCSALGLRYPKVLADRLRNVLDLSHQQIPRARYHEVNIESIILALNLAAYKRKAKVRTAKHIAVNIFNITCCMNAAFLM